MLPIKNEPKYQDYSLRLSQMFKVVISRSSELVNPEFDLPEMFLKGGK